MVWASFIFWSPFVAFSSVVVVGAAQVGVGRPRRRRGAALCGQSIEAALEDRAHRSVRASPGGERPRAGRLEAACARALSAGGRSYGSVRSILERGLDALPAERRAAPPPGPSHANLRGADYYLSLIHISEPMR